MTPIEFLQAFHPAGPWLLTAIPPDGKKIETKTFGPKSVATAKEWLTTYNGQRNLYFSVNLPNRKLEKKATRAEIHTVQWLHVDIDARAGESLPDELERIKTLLTERCPTLPPTVIVFSGGGYQAFWRLAEPIPVNGQLAAAEEVARYNKQLEIELGGDSCSNVDRIMRLPGTTNLPNAKKVERGRVAVDAKVHWFRPGNVYDIDQFEMANFKPSDKNDSLVKLSSAKIERLSDVNELDKWKVPDRVKVIIVQGHHPDEEKDGDNSRSGWLFDVCCQLVRNKVNDDVIFSIITDPNFEISAHILERGGDTRKYAERQIERAKVATQEYDRTKSGSIRPTHKNVSKAVTNFDMELRYDLLAHCVRVDGDRLSDELVNRIWGDISTRDKWSPPESLLRSILLYLAQKDTYHPVREYLAGLAWDGYSRLDNWMINYLGAEDTPYNRAVGGLLLLGAVRRARSPGCKFDTMVVLEGPQGSGKSTALRILSVRREWFADHLPLDENKQRLVEALQGSWIVEASELAGLRKADVAKLKTFLSSQEDKVRLAYGHEPSHLLRQCVVIGTTNDQTYLRDDTGNRRYLPVKTGKIELENLKEDLDQLWAEAAHQESQPGVSIKLPRQIWPAAASEQTIREERPPFFDDLEQELGEYDNCWVSVSDIRAFLGVGMKDWHGNRDMGRVMRLLGWKKTTKRDGKKQRKAYGRGHAETKLKFKHGNESIGPGTEGWFEPVPNVTQSKFV